MIECPDDYHMVPAPVDTAQKGIPGPLQVCVKGHMEPQCTEDIDCDIDASGNVRNLLLCNKCNQYNARNMLCKVDTDCNQKRCTIGTASCGDGYPCDQSGKCVQQCACRQNSPSGKCSDTETMNKLINSVWGQVLPSSQIKDPGQCGYYDQPIDNSGCYFTCPPGKIWNEWDPEEILPTCTKPSGWLKCDENTGIELDIPLQLIVNKGKQQRGKPGCVPKDSVGRCV